MLARLLLLFTLVPLAEVALLIWLARQTSVPVTVGIVLSTGFLGAALTRWQGMRAWNTVRSELAAGRLPATAAVDGLMILFAGTFLITPGLISDTCGFLLLVPRVRAAVRDRVIAYFKKRVRVRFDAFASAAGGRGDVIDAEFRRADAPPLEERPPS